MNTIILVIGHVENAPNQVRYQRIRALASHCRLYVVTPDPLPQALREVVQEVHLVSGFFAV
ncbi:hypothetical protein DT23_17235 [Thioclava indica]|uniref:Uncharacterized protein n=1 Tax=Thioclava indica TaxID=1353528 RepID=A0A074K6G6_9RHOB|nr:hypothetical protein DT23_17235 [Thioclava indica]